MTQNLLTSRPLPGRPARTVPGTEEILALADSPAVRAEKVARGKALIANPNYPSRQELKAVANLIAANW